MDRLETRHGNRDDSTESCSEAPFHQTKNKGNEDRKGKNGKYDSDYLKLGFHFTGNESESKQLCVICNKVLCTNSFKPSLLQKYIETNHPAHKDKPL